jgi:fibronectin type 3 domain-containing protein
MIFNRSIMIFFVLVTFVWEPNTEPDMSHYRLYQTYQGQRTPVMVILHPASTLSVDVPRAIVADAIYVLTAVDTEGFESGDSDQARCDTQACIDKYLKPGKVTGVDLDPGP